MDKGCVLEGRLGTLAATDYTSTGNLCSRFFLEGVNLPHAVTVSGAGAVFDPGETIITFDLQFLRALFVMSTFLSRWEHSTIVEGQRLGTVHIMQGTCSQA